MGSLVLQIRDQIPVRRLLNAKLWGSFSTLPTSGKLMGPDIERALKLAFPSEDARYFSPMTIGNTPAGTVRLSARWAEEGEFLRAESQAVAAVLEISLQIAKARSREARRKSAGTDSG